MFEGLVADTLTRFLGEYVVGLDRDKIKLGVWGGNLELNSLALHSEALATLFDTLGISVPITVRAGQIGSLKVEVPWKNLRSKPIRISLSKVSMVASPAIVANSQVVALRLSRIKSGTLGTDDLFRETRWREGDKASTGQSRYSRLFGGMGGGVTSRLITRIVENIQIELFDVLLHYEDAVSDRDRPFCLDLRLPALRLVSADKNWQVTFVEELNPTKVFKLVELNGLRANYSQMVESYDPDRPGSLHEQILQLIDLSEGGHHFIEPIDGTVQITIRRPTAKDAGDKGDAMVKLNARFDSMKVRLSDAQLGSLLSFSNELAAFKKKANEVGPKNAQERWLWCLEQILPGFRERHKKATLWSEKGIREWCARVQGYVMSRIVVLGARRDGDESRAEQDAKIVQELEEEMELSEILALRDVVDGRLNAQRDLARKAGSGAATRGRLLSLFSRKQAAEPSAGALSEQPSQAAALPPSGATGRTSEFDVLGKLGTDPRADDSDKTSDDLESMDDSASEAEVLEETDAPRLQFGILLREASLELLESQAEHLVELSRVELTGLRFGVLTRPSQGETLMEGLVGSLTLTGAGKQLVRPRATGNPIDFAALTSSYPERVAETLHRMRQDTVYAGSEDQTNLLAVRIVKSDPVASKDTTRPELAKAESSTKVAMSLTGLDVVVDGPTGVLVRSGKFWKPQNQNVDAIMEVLEKSARERLIDVRNRLEKSLKTNRASVYLDLFNRAPRVHLPGLEPGLPSIMLDLGNVSLSTEGRRTDETRQVSHMEYRLSVADLSASLQRPEPEMAGAERILKPVSVTASLQLLENENDASAHLEYLAGERLSRMRILGVMPSLHIAISHDTYRWTLQTVKSWKRQLGNSATSAGRNVDSGKMLAEGPMGATESEAQEDQTDTPVVQPPIDDVSVRFTLQDIMLELSESDERPILQLGLHGAAARVVKNSAVLNTEFRLQRIEAIDFLRGGQGRTFLFSGVKDDDIIAADNETFVYVKHRKDQLLSKQDVEVHVQLLECKLVSEIVVQLVRFLYSARPGHDVNFEDPFAAAGTTATQAARLLKDKAERVLERSRAALRRKGGMALVANLDGVSLLVTSDAGGDITEFDVTDLQATVNKSSDGDVHIDGRFEAISVRNLRTKFAEQRTFLEYGGGGKQRQGSSETRYGFTVDIPGAGRGDPSAVATMSFLKVVFVMQFLHEVQQHFKQLVSECKPIVSSTKVPELNEVFEGDAAEAVEKAAPRNARLRVTTEGIDFIIPRNSTNNHEAVKASIGSISVHNGGAPSVGYNFAFNLDLNNLSVYALYPLGAEKLPFTATTDMAHTLPILKDFCISAKMDYWREGSKFEEFDEATKTKHRNLTETNPHHRLPAIRIRTTPADGVTLRMCEGQYSVMFLVFTENFIEPSAPSFEELQEIADKNLAEGDGPSNKLPPAFRMLLSASEVGLEVIAGKDVNCAGKSLLGAAATDLALNLDFSSDARILMDLSVKVKGIYDKRRGRMARIIAPKDDSTPAVINMSLDRPFLRKSGLMVVATDTRLVLVPEFFIDIGRMAGMGEPVVETSEPGMEMPFCGKNVAVNLVRVEVVQFTDAFEHDLRCTLLRGDLFLEIHKQAVTEEMTLNIGTKDLSLVLSDAKEDPDSGERSLTELETPVIFPTELLLELGAAGDSPADGRMLHLSSTEAVTTRVALQDVKHVLDFVRKCMGVSAPPPLDDRPRPPPKPQPEGAEEAGGLTFTLSLSQLRLLVTDEPGNLYIPILELKAQRFALCSVAGQVLKIGGTLSAELYDRNKGWWVPGIEPWKLEMAISTAAKSKSIVLHAEEVLNLNVAPSTIDGAMRVFSAVKSAIKSVSEERYVEDNDERRRTRRHESSAFVVRNESGMEVSVSGPSEAGETLLGAGVNVKEFEVNQGSLIGSIRETHGATKLKILATPAGCRPKELTLSELCLETVTFSPGGLELVWEVTMENGIPMGTLRTPMRITNQTSVPLEVRCGDEKLLVEADGGYVSVPLAGLDSEVRVRPVAANGTRYQWSNLFWKRERFRSAAQRNASGAPHRPEAMVAETDGGRPWTILQSNTSVTEWHGRAHEDWQMLTCFGDGFLKHSVVPWAATVEASTSAGIHYMNLSVCSPLMLENALPRVLHMRLFRKGKNKATHLLDVSLEPLMTAPVHAPCPLPEIWAEVFYNNKDRDPSGMDGDENGTDVWYTNGFWLAESGARKLPVLVTAKDNSNTGALRIELASSVSRLRACFYADLWLRNRSDVDLYVKAWGAEGTQAGVTPLSAAPPALPANPYVSVLGPYLSLRRSSSDKWVPLGQGGALVEAQELTRPIELQEFKDRSLVVKTKTARGAFHRTTIVTVRVALWMENLTGKALQWCHSSALDKRGIAVMSAVEHVKQGDVKAVHYRKWGTEPSIRIRLSEEDGTSDWIWSCEIDANKTKSVAAKMYNPRTGEQYIARTRIVAQRGGSRKLVIYSEDTEHPPYRLVNECSDRHIAFVQLSERSDLQWLLEPGSSTRYSWDDPLASADKRALQVTVLEKRDEGNRNLGTVDLNIDRLVKLVYHFEVAGAPPLHVTIALEGPTKVVLFADSPEARLNAQPRLETVQASVPEDPSEQVPVQTVGWDDVDDDEAWNESVRADGAVSNGRSAEAEADAEGESSIPQDAAEVPERTLDVDIFLSSIGISVVDSAPEELLYLSIRNARLHIADAGADKIYVVEVQDLQIDNQLPQPQYPVLLWSPPPKASSSMPPSEQRLLLELRIVMSTGLKGITMVKAVYVALQQLQLSVEEETVMRVWASAQSILDPRARQDSEKLGSDDEGRMLYSYEGEEEVLLQCVYAEHVYLAPIKLSLNFASSRTPLPRVPGAYWGVVRTLIATFGNVENAEFRLNALDLQHVFDAKQDFMGKIGEFYTHQLLKHRMALVASNNLIGNPSVLFEHISTGARDFFIEPYRVKSGSEFLVELYKGSTSLVGNTLGGLVGAVGSIPKALAGTMEAAVGDREYALARSAIYGGGGQRTARSLGQGLSRGARSFGHGISSGVTGLFRDPIRGARVDGAAGFFKGLGKGVVGGVLKPLTGALDLIAEPTIGMRATIGTVTREVVAPVRPPRLFSGRNAMNRRLITYDFEQSLGGDIMNALKRRRTISEGAEDLVDWVLLGTERDNSLHRLWTIFSSRTRGFTLHKRKEEPKIKSGSDRIVLISKQGLFVVTTSLQLLWKCRLSNIRSLEGHAQDDTVLIVTHASSSSSRLVRSKIRCLTTSNRDTLYQILEAQLSATGKDEGDHDAAENMRRKSSGHHNFLFDEEGLAALASDALAAEPVLRKAGSHRSVRGVVLNRTDEDLAMVAEVVTAGAWARAPPKSLERKGVLTFEAESDLGITADIHGSLTLDGGGAVIGVHFVNLFLAEKAYFCDPLPDRFSVIVRGDTDVEHAEVTYIIVSTPRPIALAETGTGDDASVGSDGEAADASAEAKSGGGNSEHEQMLAELQLLGFDRQTANSALLMTNHDMVAAVDYLLSKKM